MNFCQKILLYSITATALLCGGVFAQVDHFLLEISPTTVSTDQYPTISISAVDSNNDIVTSYEGEVFFEILPADGVQAIPSATIHTMTGLVAGHSVFTGVRFPAAGAYTVVISDMSDNTLTGQAFITANHTDEMGAISPHHTISTSDDKLVYISWPAAVSGVFYSIWDPVQEQWGFPSSFYSSAGILTGISSYLPTYGTHNLKFAPVRDGYQVGPSTIYTFTLTEQIESEGGAAGPITLQFPDSLSTAVPGYATYQSVLHFNYGGNDFEGILFPTSALLLDTGVDLILNGQTISNCKKQLRGLYYSNPRGYRIWPIDGASKTQLIQANSNYADLEVSGGFFFDCDGRASDEVFGQVHHILDGYDYYLVAGVDFNTTDNSYNNTFSGTTLMSGLNIYGNLFDSQGGVAAISTTEDIPLIGSMSVVPSPSLISIMGTYYSTNGLFSVNLDSNKSSTMFTVSGDITPSIVGGTPATRVVELSYGDGQKTLRADFSYGSETDSTSLIVYLDTTTPSEVVLDIPASGATVTTYSGDMALSWTGGDDSGVGVDYYLAYVLNMSGVTLWSGYSSSKTITAHNIDVPDDYQWYVTATDQVGWTSRSSTGYFTTTTGVLDTIPNSFDLEKRRDAELSKVYQSNIVLVNGLSDGTYVLASVDAGTLFINGNYSVTSGLVKNGDVVWVELISSNRYERDVESTLTIGDEYDTFVIETMSEEDDIGDASQYEDALTRSLRWKIWLAFQEFVEAYEDKSISRQKDVFLALKDMVEEYTMTVRFKLKNTSNRSSIVKYEQQLTILGYLYEYTVNYLTDSLDMEAHLLDADLDLDGNYKAPNGKEYEITYSSTKGYYSPDISSAKYFPTLGLIKSYIDINNPDPAADISQRIIAPNGKRYNVIKMDDGAYSSLYFDPPKTFGTLNEMIRYISANNPYYGYDCQDRDMYEDALSHTTPNQKTYSIYLSEEGKYYSPDTDTMFCYEYLNDLVAVLNARNE